MIKLKPCPFCGSHDLMMDPIELMSYFPNSVVVECFGCGARCPRTDGTVKARTAWNRRTKERSKQ